jgi:hypothetical protein
MMKSIGEARIRRTHDRSAGRQPLRLTIGRRRARTRGGDEKFVTQVQLGGARALVIPWRERPV